jgi:outer membrane protein OmpA-like peptidoglycan-associated protein
MRIAGSFILLTFALQVMAQNLVPNPGFEQYFKCPGSYNYSASGKLAPSWYSPSTGTPDLFNKCSIGEAGVPENWAGRSNTYNGSGYAGIYGFISGRNTSYREYLQAELSSPLEAGATYLVEFYYRLSSNSKYSIDRIGFLLSDSAQRIQHDGVFPHKPTYEKITQAIYNPKTSGTWLRIAYSHIAKGGERFITIGNFSDDTDTRNYFIQNSQSTEPMLNRAAYFFIDDVKVVLTSEPAPAPPPSLAGYEELKPYENYVLQNVQFNFNESVLLGQSFTELNKVVEIMKFHKQWKAVIAGHTDDVGTDQYNIGLSLERANSVVDYLVKKGINPVRLKIEGYGKQMPLKKGNDEATRSLNRRVEIRFTL